jgi:hypothetical protein
MQTSLHYLACLGGGVNPRPFKPRSLALLRPGNWQHQRAWRCNLAKRSFMRRTISS